MMVAVKYYTHNRLVYLAGFILLFFILMLLMGGKSEAISGASSYFPDTSYGGQGNSFAIVQVTGTNVPSANAKMKARTTIANIYVPRTLEGQNVTVNVVNGCDGTIRDNDPFAGHTNFRVRNSSRWNVVTSNWGVTEASVNTNASVWCLVGDDIQITFPATPMDPTSPNYTRSFTFDNGVEYNVYQFIADGVMNEAGNNRRYLNAFGLTPVTGGMQVGISSFPEICDNFNYPISCPSPRVLNGFPASYVYTSFYGPLPASILPSYNQKISIRSNCALNGGISFYDLDANDASLSAQDNLSIRLLRQDPATGVYTALGTFAPNGTYIDVISKPGIVNWGPGIPGILNPHPGFGGNNDEYMDIPGGDPMFTSLGDFTPNVNYELQINDVDSDNAIQILPNYPLCQRPNNVPTVTVNGSPNCESFAFTVNDADGDRVEIYLLVDGSRVVNAAAVNEPQFNLVNQAASNTPYSFDLTSWRDFRQRTFQVVVYDGRDTANTAVQTIGPCVRMTCGGISVSQASLEVNRPFDISVNFITKKNYPTNTDDLGIGSRGVSETYNVNINFTSAGFVAPPNPVVAGATITNLSPNPLPHNVTGFRAPPTEADTTISYSLDSANNNLDVVCDGVNGTSLSVARIPYVQGFRGDIIAGYGMKNVSGVCTTDSTSTVSGSTTESLTNATDYVGSGTQGAVFALGAVRGFGSAITETSKNDSPWVRIFANTSPLRNATGALDNVNNFGGSLDSSLCAENWFDDQPAPATTISLSSGAILDISPLRNISRYTGNGGPVTISASSPITGTRKVFIDGDVIIGNGGADIVNTTTWTSIYDIPSTIIVSTGNIFIDDNIRNLDAILVSQGTIFTCTPTTAVTLPNNTEEVGDVNPGSYVSGGGCYSESLTVHGALVANSVRLWRMGGSTTKAVNAAGVEVDSSGGQDFQTGLTKAETFRLSPDMYIAPRFGENPTNGEQGKKQYDSLVSLPPPF